MTLPTTKPNDPDLPWYIAECMDLKKHLAIECAAKHEYLRMINELKVKAGFYEQEIARLRADKERLDWLLTDDGGHWVNWMYDKNEWTPELKASRDGIDAAKRRGHE